ncbi:MAG: tRNA pseudouridine(38-40) synthase TruA [Lysobacterales bacterium]
MAQITDRIALGIEYDGSRFLGWQTQAQTPTVQSELERALGQVADHPITVHGAGRTDTGVHAAVQVAHFDAPCVREPKAWVLGTNTHLPDDLRVLWAVPVAVDFNARFSAVSRRYCYRIMNRSVRPALARLNHAWVAKKLDEGLMHQAAQALLGEHDFSAFRASSCQARHATRRMTALSVTRQGETVTLSIEGNAFLHHMVRNIVGSLLLVGKAEKPPEWIFQLLTGRDRRRAGPTAPAAGLTLEQVVYPAAFGIPA